MPLDRGAVRRLLEAFDLRTLFVEEPRLGPRWRGHLRPCGRQDVPAGSHRPETRLRRVSVRLRRQSIPDYPTRQKIWRQAAKATHEHLIVFAPT